MQPGLDKVRIQLKMSGQPANPPRKAVDPIKGPHLITGVIVYTCTCITELTNKGLLYISTATSIKEKES